MNVTRDGELSSDEMAILDFERNWANLDQGGRKESAIRDVFDISPTVYYSALNVLRDKVAAWAYDPVTTKRLRRLRDARRAVRTAS